MAKPNYGFQKRQKDLEKKRKKEEKRRRKQEVKDPPAENPTNDSVSEEGAP